MNISNRNRDKIIEYIKSGEKQKDNLTIGLELEHIVVCKETFHSIPFDNGVELIMKKLLLKGWEKSDDEPSLVNIKKNEDSITLEPGAQLELSIKNCKSIDDVKERYFSFINDILPILDESNYYLLSIGYRPLDKVKDITMIPKIRYGYMSEYLMKKGKYALNMMKGSAALQISIDYTDEEDYIKKNRVANYLSPAVSLIFDNTPMFEGEVFQGNTARVDVWNNMDNERCRIIPGTLNGKFGYKEYAEYIISRPCIIALLDGKYVYTGDRIIQDVYKEIEMDEAQVEHLISMFFPDVRTKKYIEIRMIDSVPFPYNFASAAFWKAILYNQENLDYFYQQSLRCTDEQIKLLKEGMISNQKNAIESLNAQVDEVLEKAMNVLDDDDKEYLKPLIELKNNSYNLSSHIKSELINGIPAALYITALSVKNLNLRGLR